MPKCIYFEGLQEYISEGKKNRWQKSENFWFCGSIKCSWRTLLCSQTHAKYTHKQIAYNQCLKLPLDGKAESKWWSLCRGSLKACGLEVSLYTFLFSERVAVCVCERASVFTPPLPCLLCEAVKPPWIRLGQKLQGGRMESNHLWLWDNIIFSSLAWIQPLNSTVRLRREQERRDTLLKCQNGFS